MTANLHARRLYVGSIPPNTPDAAVVLFLTEMLRKAGGILEEGDPVLRNHYNPEKHFLFLEMRSVEEAATMIQLDGIKFQSSILKLRRPEDFEKMPPVAFTRPIPALDLAPLGIISTKVEESATKVFVGGLPKDFSEEQIKNLLLRYGALKSFHMVRDGVGVQSRGFAFCEFSEEKGVQNALKFLNGMRIGGNRSINVRRTGMHSSMVVQSQMSEEEKSAFCDKMEDFIYETGKYVAALGVGMLSQPIS